MADVELVIKIPEEDYEHLKAGHTKEVFYGDAIAKGIPLPKGHGRLGDLDALETEMTNGIKAGNYEKGYENYGHILNMDDCVECVRYAETIIEADKEEKNGRSRKDL